MTASERHTTTEGLSIQDLDRAIAVLIDRAKEIVGQEVLDREEAAAYVKYSPVYFDELVSLGKFRVHRMTENGSPRYLRRELVEDVAAHVNGRRESQTMRKAS